MHGGLGVAVVDYDGGGGVGEDGRGREGGWGADVGA